MYICMPTPSNIEVPTCNAISGVQKQGKCAVKCEEVACCLAFGFVNDECAICGYFPPDENQVSLPDELFFAGIYLHRF